MAAEVTTAEWVFGAPISGLPGRSGHTATPLGRDERVLIFGGAAQGGLSTDEVTVVNARTGEHWAVSSEARAPAPRMAHTTSAIATRGVALLFGGGNGRQLFGDVWLLALRPDDFMRDGRACWTELECGGAPPAARMGHAACMLGSERALAYFGGFVRDELNRGVYSADCHLLEIGSWRWSRVRDAGAPSFGRLGSTAAACEGRAYFFGGSAAGRVLDELHSLDPSDGALRALAPTGAPTARAHAQSLVVGGSIVWVGGTGADGEPTAVLDVLDTRTLSWSRPARVLSPAWALRALPARAKHTLTALAALDAASADDGRTAWALAFGGGASLGAAGADGGEQLLLLRVCATQRTPPPPHPRCTPASARGEARRGEAGGEQSTHYLNVGGGGGGLDSQEPRALVSAAHAPPAPLPRTIAAALRTLSAARSPSPALVLSPTAASSDLSAEGGADAAPARARSSPSAQSSAAARSPPSAGSRRASSDSCASRDDQLLRSRKLRAATTPSSPPLPPPAQRDVSPPLLSPSPIQSASPPSRLPQPPPPPPRAPAAAGSAALGDSGYTEEAAADADELVGRGARAHEPELANAAETLPPAEPLASAEAAVIRAVAADAAARAMARERARLLAERADGGAPAAVGGIARAPPTMAAPSAAAPFANSSALPARVEPASAAPASAAPSSSSAAPTADCAGDARTAPSQPPSRAATTPHRAATSPHRAARSPVAFGAAASQPRPSSPGAFLRARTGARTRLALVAPGAARSVNLATELAEARDELRRARAERDEANAARAALAERAAALTAERDALVDERGALGARAARLAGAAKASEDKARAYAAAAMVAAAKGEEAAQVRAALDAARTEAAELRESVGALVEAARRAHASRQTEVASLAAECERLRAELQQARAHALEPPAPSARERSPPPPSLAAQLARLEIESAASEAEARKQSARAAEREAALQAAATAAQDESAALRRELLDVRRQAAEASALTEHVKELFVGKATEAESLKDALALAHAHLQAARDGGGALGEAVAAPRALAPATPTVCVAIAGGAADDARGGERELRLRVTDERVAHGEAIVEKLRAFLQEHPAGGSDGLGAQRRAAQRQQRAPPVASLFAPRSSHGATLSPAMARHPPMRFTAN